jgi:hypothetical protein
MNQNRHVDRVCKQNTDFASSQFAFDFQQVTQNGFKSNLKRSKTEMRL